MSVSTSMDVPAAAAVLGLSSGALPQAGGGTATASAAPAASSTAASANAADTVTATAVAASAATKPASADDVGQAAAEIAAFLSSSKTNIVFAMDQSSGQMVVKIQDAATGKTLRQIPSEVVLRIAQELKQNKTLSNLQFDEKA
jgi:flagellar protein FlaG